MGIILESNSKMLIKWVCALLMLCSGKSLALEYYNLSKQFYNDPAQISGEIVSPFRYTIIKELKNEDGISYEFLENEESSHPCFLNYVGLDKVKFNTRYMNILSPLSSASTKKLQSSLFVSSRVDTIFLVKENGKLETYLWGKDSSMMSADLNKISLNQAMNVFCDNLGYEGVVVDVTKNSVTIFSRREKFSSLAQAVIYEQNSKAVFLKNNKSAKAKAILSYVGSNNNLHTFKIIIGETNIFDKVNISKN